MAMAEQKDKEWLSQSKLRWKTRDNKFAGCNSPTVIYCH